MKNSILLFFLFLNVSVSLAQEPKKNQKAVIKTTIYCSHCKVCETCGKNFQANMHKIKGLKMYELDDQQMTITVYFNSEKTDLQTIKTAISHLGYDADEIKADAVAYDKLDSCCKKA